MTKAKPLSFSVTHKQIATVESLARHFKVSRSRVVQSLIAAAKEDRDIVGLGLKLLA